MKEIGEFLYNNLVNNNPNVNDNKKVDDFNNIFNLDLYSEEDQNTDT